MRNGEFQEQLEKNLAQDKHRTLIIPGDFTRKAGSSEYRRTAYWLGDLINRGIKVLVTVGNHDMSQSILIARIPLKKGYKRFSCLMDIVGSQSCLIARMDEFDAIYKIGRDVFYAARTTHSKVYKGTRIKKEQLSWARTQLLRHGLITSNGYRLHLLTHQSLWKLKGDAHSHVNKRKRLVTNLLKPLGFSTSINGHNHRFDHGVRQVKKGNSFSMQHIQAPTLSSRTKGHFLPGFLTWDPSETLSVSMNTV